MRGKTFEEAMTVRFSALMDRLIEDVARRYDISKAEVIRRCVFFALVLRRDEFEREAFSEGEEE